MILLEVEASSLGLADGSHRQQVEVRAKLQAPGSPQLEPYGWLG